MIFSLGAGAPISPELYREGFFLPKEAAEQELREMLDASFLPFSLHEGGEVLSQGLGLPFTVNRTKLLYLYALTTRTSSRGGGLLRTLLKRVAAECAGEYAALCLLPANEALAAAYLRMGFTHACPAGADANGGLPLFRFSRLPVYHEISVEELYALLPPSLPLPAFRFAVASLENRYLPARIEGGGARLLRDDPCAALAISASPREAVKTREGAPYFLLAPLGKELPPYIPEPLPR